MKLKYNIWHIDGYSGWSDYDGPSDCNHHEDIVMDAQYSKKDVVDMWMSRYSGRTVAVAKCELVGSGVIDTDDKNGERLTKLEDGIKRLIKQKEEEKKDIENKIPKASYYPKLQNTPFNLIELIGTFKNELQEILETE